MTSVNQPEGDVQLLKSTQPNKPDIQISASDIISPSTIQIVLMRCGFGAKLQSSKDGSEAIFTVNLQHP